MYSTTGSSLIFSNSDMMTTREDILLGGCLPLCGCLMVTLPARVLHPFMNCSFVSIKMTLRSCLIVTLPARVLHPFMNGSFVLWLRWLFDCAFLPHSAHLNIFCLVLFCFCFCFVLCCFNLSYFVLYFMLNQWTNIHVLLTLTDILFHIITMSPPSLKNKCACVHCIVLYWILFHWILLYLILFISYSSNLQIRR